MSISITQNYLVSRSELPKKWPSITQNYLLEGVQLLRTTQRVAQNYLYSVENRSLNVSTSLRTTYSIPQNYLFVWESERTLEDFNYSELPKLHDGTIWKMMSWSVERVSLLTRADLGKAEARLPGAIDFALIADARQIILNETTATRAN